MRFVQAPNNSLENELDRESVEFLPMPPQEERGERKMARGLSDADAEDAVANAGGVRSAGGAQSAKFRSVSEEPTSALGQHLKQADREMKKAKKKASKKAKGARIAPAAVM